MKKVLLWFPMVHACFKPQCVCLYIVTYVGISLRIVRIVMYILNYITCIVCRWCIVHIFVITSLWVFRATLPTVFSMSWCSSKCSSNDPWLSEHIIIYFSCQELGLWSMWYCRAAITKKSYFTFFKDIWTGRIHFLVQWFLLVAFGENN